MTTWGLPAWNRGKKFPHSPEWEAKRLEAVRKAAANRIWPKGYTRPREYIEPMLKALTEKMATNPGKYKKIAIQNLPKDVNGPKNGNWKGGITLKTRGLRFSKEYKSWRKVVIERDGPKCRICGSEEKLQVHHLVPMSQYPILATLPMNGVVLCNNCHYENDEAWQGKRFTPVSCASTIALIFVIPHKFQAYKTVGNWQFTDSGFPVIFVSKLSDRRYEMLVTIHELIEVCLCKHAGITQYQVDKFDIKFEKNRPVGNYDEPGDDPKAPYRFQHCIATGVERMLAAVLGICWSTYEAEINALV